MQYVRKFFKDESGATAIEYGLMAGLIAVFVIPSVSAVGTAISGKFNAVAKSLK